MLTIEKTKELLKSIGDGTVELDENNCCEIGVPESDIVVNLRFVAEDGRLLLGTVIGELPDSSPVVLAHLLGELMKANFMWDLTLGNTLSLVDDSRIVLQNFYTESAETTFAEMLLNFCENTEFMTAWYTDLKNETVEAFRENKELIENDIDVDLTEDESETVNGMISGANIMTGNFALKA